MVITTESGTTLTFFGRDSSCQINGTSSNWRAGRDHIRKGLTDFSVIPTYLSAATNESDNICISEMIFIATNDTLRQPISNTFYFEENGTTKAVCLLGHSIAHYFVILVNDDSDICQPAEVNNKSSMDTNDTMITNTVIATNDSMETSTQTSGGNGSTFTPPFSVQQGTYSYYCPQFKMRFSIVCSYIIYHSKLLLHQPG